MLMTILISAMFTLVLFKLASGFVSMPIQGKMVLFGIFNFGVWYLLPTLIEQTSLTMAQQELFHNIATFCFFGGIIMFIVALFLKIRTAT